MTVKHTAQILFLAFLLPVVNHGFWAIAETIQNGMQRVGNTQTLWDHHDLAEPFFRLPWSLWIYFAVMVGLALWTLSGSLKERHEKNCSD